MSRKKLYILAAALGSILIGFIIANLWADSPAMVKPGSLSRGSYDALDEYASKYIRQQMNQHRIVGLSVAVIDGQKTVWAKGFGYADRSRALPATPATVYKTGSISKLLNAIALLKLREQGKIDFDKPLALYIPEFSVKSHYALQPPLTLRSLLTHHSGLPSDYAKGMWSETSPEPFETILDILRNEYVAYPPAYMYSYSNIGSTLAGIAVQRVSSQNYADYLEENILRPLGMTNSSFAATPAITPLLAKSYNKDGAEQADVALRDIPAGNLHSSVLDLGKFLMLIFNSGQSSGGRFLTSASIAEMIAPQNAGNPLDGTSQIGLEFFLDFPEFNYAGGAAGHGGQTYLFHGQLLALPVHKLGVVVLANSAGGRHAVKPIASELLKAALEIKTGLVPSAAGVDSPVRALIGNQPAPDKIDGFYGTAAGLAEVTNDGGRLRLKVMDRKLTLLPRADGWFTPQYRLAGLIPVPIAKLSQMAIAVKRINNEDILFFQEGRKISAVGKKIEEYDIEQAWRDRLGIYHANGYENNYLQIDYLQLKIRQGFLVIEISTQNSQADLVLKPVTATEAVIYALGRRMMETIRADRTGGNDALVFAGIRFDKAGKQPQPFTDY